jgi:nitroreductase
MDAIEAILSRRSIRSYTNRIVTEDTVRELLNAAMSAPSAGNEQPWHFIVIRDRNILDKIPEFHPFSEMLKIAGVAILVCGDISLEKYEGFWVQDCAAATQNILIAANAIGLGTVWLGLYPHMDRVEGMRKLLKLPKTVMPLSLIPVGYPAVQKNKADRFNESRIHFDQW